MPPPLMPPRTRRARFAQHSVTAVVISHDGARWLPECLAALSQQTRPPQRVVAVDTGSTDASVPLLTDMLGTSAVVSKPRDTALGDAVQAGLDAFAGAPTPPGLDVAACEWVWVLHDDSVPDDDALEQLLTRAEQSPTASALGPKVLSWDRRVLVEVGVTVDSSGHRETGLEPRELDQGQHDDVSDVLAVGTAGLLVRRDVWDSLGGLDRTWPFAGTDVDFGWRINANGGRVLVATQAVLRHARGLTTRRRTCDAIRSSYGAAVRGHGMQVVLANTSPWLVLPLALRLVVESLLRSIGALLLLRRASRAGEELTGLGMLLTGVPRIVRARRARRHLRVRPHRQVRHLLAPPGVRLRRAGDAFAVGVAGRRAVVERQRRRAPVETGPVAAESESFVVDDLGVLARIVTRPGMLLFVALCVLALIADRSLLGGSLHGGRLLPPTAGASDLWSDYTSTWHPVELGSTSAAPPVLALLALLSSVLVGKVWLAVDVLLLGAVPFAGLSAYLAAGAVTRRTALRIWAGVAYALVPVMTGAVSGGRIDVVIATILLPAAARAIAAALAPGAALRGLHRAFGAGLVLALVVAAVPGIWPVAAVALLAAVLLSGAGALRRLPASLVVLVVPAVVLLPMAGRLLRHPTVWLTGAGLPDTFASRRGVGVADLLLLHPGGPAQPPLWVWAPVVLAAVVAVATRRRAARFGFVVFVVGAAAAVVVSRLTPTGVVSFSRYWSGAMLAVAATGALAAAVAAADSAPDAMRRAAFGWRQPAAALLAAAAVAGTAVAAVSWLSRGADRPLDDSSAQLLPVFAQAEAAAPSAPRTLVLRVRNGVVHYTLLRSPNGLLLGDADVAADRGAHRVARGTLAAAVADAAAGRPEAAGELAGFGILLVVVPADSEHALQALGAVDGLERVPATTTTVYRTALPTGELMVLSAPDAGAALAGKPLGAKAASVALTADPGDAHVAVDPGSGDRLLVLAEPRSPAWRARLDGTALTPSTAFGWAQAWHLPADGGQVVVTRPDGGRQTLLITQLVLLVAVVALCIPVRGAAHR